MRAWDWRFSLCGRQSAGSVFTAWHDCRVAETGDLRGGVYDGVAVNLLDAVLVEG